MTTSIDTAWAYCQMLHQSLATELCAPGSVRDKVDRLRRGNSFAESCFCKGCVLPLVDTVTTAFLAAEFGATRHAIRCALRCEGFATPMYACDSTQVGFASHSRSNSYHPGDKSGRRTSSRRSPDFCVRFPPHLSMLGEVKYVEAIKNDDKTRLIHEMKDYLSIIGESTSDWGHDFAFGILYEFGGDTERVADQNLQLWESDRIFLSCFRRS